MFSGAEVHLRCPLDFIQVGGVQKDFHGYLLSLGDLYSVSLFLANIFISKLQRRQLGQLVVPMKIANTANRWALRTISAPHQILCAVLLVAITTLGGRNRRSSWAPGRRRPRCFEAGIIAVTAA